MKSIKIAPGVRINFTESGVSTSIGGGKGFTYNTRGRIATSVPVTGIHHTHNLNSELKSEVVYGGVEAGS